MLLILFAQARHAGRLLLLEEIGFLGNIAVLIGSLLVLDRVSDLTITNAAKIADLTGYGRTTMGFIFVAFCTSLSALAVSLFSALTVDNVGVAIGNAIGSNIVNICLILGVSLILATLKKLNHMALLPSLAKEEIGSLYFGLFVASIIPLTLIYIGYASKLVGIVLLGIFGAYTYQLSKKRTTEEKTIAREKERIDKYAVVMFLGVAVVVAVSYFIVASASNIAFSLGVPHVIIGATIVAFGTSIPVLTASIHAVQRGLLDLTLGNIVGTCFIDTTFILGLTLVVSPLMIDISNFSSLVMFSVIANLFLWYFLSSAKIGWREGAVLIFLYVLFLVISISGFRS